MFPEWACAALLVSAFPSLRADDESLKSQAPVADEAIAQSAPNAYRILFIGDSITRHGTSPDILARLGWDHIAGMAASSEDKDYAHLLAAKIQGTMPDRKVEIYFDSQAKKLRPVEDTGLRLGSAAQKVALLQATANFQPHLVVIQLGEHETPAAGEESLRRSYDQLVTLIAKQNPSPQIICTGVWMPRDAATHEDYYAAGWAGAVDRVMSDVCRAHGIPFASVRPFALDPGCRGSGTNPGVQWHPNDKGMEGYAQVLFEAFRRAVSSQ